MDCLFRLNGLKSVAIDAEIIVLLVKYLRDLCLIKSHTILQIKNYDESL